jgi:hypothetical protein
MPNTYLAVLTVDSLHYIWDENRNKTLSITKVYLRAGTHRRTVTNEYMHLEDGQPAMTVGDALIRDATIMGITANCETNHNWAVKIFRKGVTSPLVTLNMVGQNYKKDSTLNVDVSGGSVLLFKVEGINVPFPRVFLELAWRVTV